MFTLGNLVPGAWSENTLIVNATFSVEATLSFFLPPFQMQSALNRKEFASLGEKSFL